jgi:hypothetical protein
MASNLQILLAVLAVLIVVYVVFKRAAANASPGKNEESVSPLLCKFVSHEGSIVGEVVAIEDETLILKQSGTFKSIPRASAHLHGDEVHLTGEIDWATALTAGAVWKENVTKGLDEQVTAQLTTSDDVRNPALQAFNKRQAELEEE